ncbi:MAG: DUF3450 family protein [Kiritimatiellia bacterium]
MKMMKLVCLISLVAAVAMAQDFQVFDDQSDKLEKWIETRKLISEEREAWRVGKEMLESRIDLVEGESKELTQHTQKIKNSVYSADKELLDLKKEREMLKESTVGLTLVIHELEVRVINLMARSPNAIQEHVKSLLQRIPKERESKLSLSERFQNVIGVLNEVNKFARDITVISEVKQLEDGKTAEVTAMYLGLGAGYYYNDKGNIAGYGYPGEKSWLWEEDKTLVQPVSDAVSIFRNEKPAAYVSLPVEVHEQTPEQ